MQTRLALGNLGTVCNTCAYLKIRKYGRPRAESIVHYQSQVACIVRKTRKLFRREPGTDFVGLRRDAPPLRGEVWRRYLLLSV